jgi:hypothetical protein
VGVKLGILSLVTEELKLRMSGNKAPRRILRSEKEK